MALEPSPPDGSRRNGDEPGGSIRFFTRKPESTGISCAPGSVRGAVSDCCPSGQMDSPGRDRYAVRLQLALVELKASAVNAEVDNPVNIVNNLERSLTAGRTA